MTNIVCSHICYYGNQRDAVPKVNGAVLHGTYVVPQSSPTMITGPKPVEEAQLRFYANQRSRVTRLDIATVHTHYAGLSKVTLTVDLWSLRPE